MTGLSGTLHTLCANYFISGKNAFLGDNVKKYSRGGQVTHDNKEHAHCMLDN